ncbi:hypothetical protein F4604DRAFT_1686163 [Suillus subluteus]|nr:hypothetical protein F4604DRAFT_1686163 [Suillus subluteus]
MPPVDLSKSDVPGGSKSFAAELAACYSQIWSSLAANGPSATSTLDQGIVKLDADLPLDLKIDSEMSPLPQASSQKPIASYQSRYIGGIEVVDADLDCLRNSQQRIGTTVMDAYASLVSDGDPGLTKAGCVILSSMVPELIYRGKPLKITSLESIVSLITKSRMLASRLWAFPLCGGDPPHWILGWVDWSTHEIGFFDSLGTYPSWAQMDLQNAAAGLEHWLKYETYPEIESLKYRFKDWRFCYHSPPAGQKQHDGWSYGLFVIMAIPGLSNLDFSYVRKSDVNLTKSSTLNKIKKVSLVAVSHRSRKQKRLAQLDHSKPSSSSNDVSNNPVLETSGSWEVQTIIETILNAKNLVIICGPGVSIPTGLPCLLPDDPLGLLRPIIWQDQSQSSLVFQAMLHHLNRASIKNKFYQRVYTQNIDAMEKTAGVLSFGVPTSSQIGKPDCPRCIPLLGRLDQMTCTLSHHVVPSATFLNQSPSDGLPICTACKPYTHHGHHGIRRPNIVVCKEEQLNLNSILDHDKNLVDVVLAVGIHPLPYYDHPGIIKQFVQAVRSKNQPEVPSSILIDLDTSILEKTEVHDQFQISLALDLQDFFGRIIVAAYQDAYHNPASNTMVIPRKLGLMDFSMKHSNNIEEVEEEEEEEEDHDGDKLLLALRPWYFPDP